MTYKKSLACFIAFLALAVFAISSVSAAPISSVNINDMEVNGIDVEAGSVTVAEFNGRTVPVRVQFDTDNWNASDVSEDVRVRVKLSGTTSDADYSDYFDVLGGRTYARVLSVPISADLDEREESIVLTVYVESKNEGILDERTVTILVQRESYLLEVLDVDFESQVTAGDTLPLDVVIRNMGSHFADNTFVKVSIPALGIDDRAWFDDLSNKDNEPSDDDVDSRERRLYLNIPENAPTGLYTIEVEAYNDDTSTKLTRTVAIVATGEETLAVSPSHSKTFGVGSTADYSLILVNTGDNIQVYELVVNSVDGLDVDLSDSIVAVPAGTSKTVQVYAKADREGKLAFDVNVYSNGQQVKTEHFLADVEKGAFAADSTVVITVILAIVFIVLLIVLIVLLTRSPQRAEDIGESYY